MPRAVWKGTIRLDGVSVPVKLYSAVQDHDVHFRLLHRKDRTPVQQHMVNPETGEIVPDDRVRRGVEVEPGVFVVVDGESLEGLKPEASRDIEVTRFVEPGAIDHQWYDRPYFLGPDDNAGDYFALAAALRNTGKLGVARWVMRDTEYVGTLCVEGDHLMLITLRHAGEVVPASQLPAPGGRKLEPKEIAMAKQLVSALEDDFDPADFRDEYRDRVMELIDTKSKGGSIELKKPSRRKPSKSLADALEASVRGAGKEKKKVA